MQVRSVRVQGHETTGGRPKMDTRKRSLPSNQSHQSSNKDPRSTHASDKGWAGIAQDNQSAGLTPSLSLGYLRA